MVAAQPLSRGVLLGGIAGALLMTAGPGAGQAPPTARPASLQKVTLPFVFSGVYLGDLPADLDASGEPASVTLKDFLRLLGERVTPALTDKVRLASADADSIPLQSLRSAGLTIDYDPSTLELRGSIPLTQQGRRTLSIFERGELIESDLDPSAAFGGSVILSTNQVINHQDRLADAEPIRSSAQSALNVGGPRGLSLLSEFYYEGAEQRKFRRGPVVLLHERRGQALRFMAGDLVPESANFQGSLPLGGFGVQKSYSELQPYRQVRPSGLFGFALEEPSIVEVVVNGAPVRAIRLERGQYNLSDFNFLSGLNEVEIYAVDDFGRRRIASFSQFFNYALLDPGLSEFGAYAGFRQERGDQGHIRYRSDQPFFTGYYRRGLTQSITAGADVQASRDQQLLGATALLTGALGTIALSGGLSNDRAAGMGQQFLASYEASGEHFSFIANPTLNAEVRYRSRNFIAVGGIPNQDVTAWDLRFRLAGTVFKRVGVGMSALVTSRRDGRPTNRLFNLSAGTAIGRFNLLVNGERARTAGQSANRFFLTLSRSVGPRGTARASYDSRGRLGQLEYSRFRGEALGDLGLRASLSRDVNGFTGSGDLSYNLNRAFVTLRHDAVTDLDGRRQSQRTSYSVSSQLAFANGGLALGRPVGPNFVIARPHRTLHGDVEITQGVDDAQVLARSGRLGPALGSAGPPHSPRKATIRAKSLPDGYDPGRTYFSFLPGSATAYVVVIGSDASHSVQGSMADSAGRPLALVVGELISIDDPKMQAKTVFTNRAGRFVVTGLAPGRYRIVAGPDKLSAEIVVKKSDEGIIDIGKLPLRNVT